VASVAPPAGIATVTAPGAPGVTVKVYTEPLPLSADAVPLLTEKSPSVTPVALPVKLAVTVNDPPT
jgi:hypothetical protein